mmetsp:Transcript_87753/g.221451  ORF Transcript_87753/g.221451 Transcript_87753/m.221451 type:complete len:139 (+) Transcript_87753:131-547(+)
MWGKDQQQQVASGRLATSVSSPPIATCALRISLLEASFGTGGPTSFLMRGLALFGPRSGNSAVPRRQQRDARRAPASRDQAGGAGDEAADTESPPTAICIRSLFAGGTDSGFVHQKGGFRDLSLLQRCDAPVALAAED